MSCSKAKEKLTHNETLDRIQKFEEELAKIQAATQITDFDKLVNIFVKNEEKNFQMFKYVNELSNEIESLEKTIGELKVNLAVNLANCLHNIIKYRKKEVTMKAKERM